MCRNWGTQFFLFDFWVSWISRWMHEVRVGGRINHISEPEFRIYISMGTQHWKRHVYSCIFCSNFQRINNWLQFSIFTIVLLFCLNLLFISTLLKAKGLESKMCQSLDSLALGSNFKKSVLSEREWCSAGW